MSSSLQTFFSLVMSISPSSCTNTGRPYSVSAVGETCEHLGGYHHGTLCHCFVSNSPVCQPDKPLAMKHKRIRETIAKHQSSSFACHRMHQRLSAYADTPKPQPHLVIALQQQEQQAIQVTARNHTASI